MKTEKFNLFVDGRFERFLNTLPQPLELNNIRTLKEQKYNELRRLLTNHTGSPILKLLKDNADALDLDCDVFDLVYEGFWDLYTLKPKCKDVSSNRLQKEWIKRVNLKAGESKDGPGDAPPEEKEEAAEEQPPKEEEKEGEEAAGEKPEEQEQDDVEDVIEPVDAVVRIKIPKVMPEV